MSEPLLIRVQCKAAPEDALLFEGRVQRKKSPSPRGVFDLMVGDILTPLGLPLQLDVFYDATELVGLKAYPARQRLERVLRQLATFEDDGRTKGHIRVTPPLSNAELAGLISVSPEHLSRLKRQMEGLANYSVKVRPSLLRLSKGIADG